MIWLPGIAVLGVVFLVKLIRSKARITELPLIRFGIVVAILISTFVLLRYYVPRRIAFMASVAEFEALVAQAPVLESDRTPLNKRVGVFVVEDYAVDFRGGVYFRVYQSGDWLWRDATSYGFVHQPNREGSPYGGEIYKLHRLGDGWYWFRATEESF